MNVLKKFPYLRNYTRNTLGKILEKVKLDDVTTQETLFK